MASTMSLSSVVFVLAAAKTVMAVPLITPEDWGRSKANFTSQFIETLHDAKFGSLQDLCDLFCGDYDDDYRGRIFCEELCDEDDVVVQDSTTDADNDTSSTEKPGDSPSDAPSTMSTSTSSSNENPVTTLPTPQAEG